MPDAIAVLIPCYNEGKTIGTVVRGFKEALPSAKVYVYDNNSIDSTSAIAHAAGAIVRAERQQGKGAVVRRMFADIDADIYVIADGDLTYDASSAPLLIEALQVDNLDMVVARRMHEDHSAYRPGHIWGNYFFTRSVELLFGKGFNDILSGYRVLSRRFVKSFPMLSVGFEVETEMTIHALSLRMAIAEVDTKYVSRPEGSTSKLNKWSDGFRILARIFILLKNERPFYLFSTLSAFCVLLSLATGFPVIDEFLHTGLVPRLPTAVAAASLMVIGIILAGLGVSLDSLGRFRAETRRLAYLSYPSVHSDRGRSNVKGN